MDFGVEKERHQLPVTVERLGLHALNDGAGRIGSLGEVSGVVREDVGSEGSQNLDGHGGLDQVAPSCRESFFFGLQLAQHGTGRGGVDKPITEKVCHILALPL